MNLMLEPGKLFICLVNRHKGEQLVAVTKEAGARGGTICHGRSIEGNGFLRALSLADVQHDVVFTLMRDEAEAVLKAVKKACAKNAKKLGGLAVLLNVSGLLVRLRQAAANGYAPEMNVRSRTMESPHVLITVIVNRGYADDVMAVARKAGATGGTIINAQGTGTEEDVKFFGISLVPEKEMLFIVAAREKAQAIVAAVNTVPNLCKPGGGIVFTVDVEEFVVLGS